MLRALRAIWLGEEGGEAEATTPRGRQGTGALARPAPFGLAGHRARRLRAALEEIDSYLADRVPPLTAADSVAELVKAPVEGAAAEIWAWACARRP